jgi:hypothetical protein
MQFEVEASLHARSKLESVWRESRRQYEGIPKQPVRSSPIPNAPNIEVPIGAIAADSIYANALDALFAASPLLVVRATNAEWVAHAKAMQQWVNWLPDNELDMRRAVENAFLDVTQLGTGAYYIPFIEEVYKNDTHRVTNRGPRIIAIPPENLLIPGTSNDSIQDARWVGLRFFFTPVEVRDRARANKRWDISRAMPVAHVDSIRMQREEYAHVRSGLTIKEFFEFVDVYCRFDYDDDGEDEDLLVTWDRSAQAIIAVGYGPYDKRPIEKMVYQPRAHMPYGMGVMEMLQPFQEEATELHNYKILNSMLANARVWVTETGSGVDESTEIWPSRVLQVNDVNKLQALQMADVYPGMAIFEEHAMRYAEQRVGLRGELSMLAKGGSRTPATTALSLLQQANRRFTPAFDQMRLGTANAVKQAIMRYAERAKMGDERVRKEIVTVMGEDQGALVWGVLRQPDFGDAVQIEFTAASATVSRESDRQNALALAQAMDALHNNILGLVEKATLPGVPEPLRRVVIKLIEDKQEMWDRLIRTFDLVRDPATLVPNVLPELEEANRMAVQAEQEAQMQQQALMGLVGLDGGAGGGAGGLPGGFPAEEPPPGFLV